MDRRSFLMRIGGTLVAVPVALVAVACGSDDAEVDAANATQFSVTSSGAHTHALTIICADLQGTGVTYTSGSGGGHSHQVTLTAAQVGQLAAGELVTVAITTPHAHSWAIRKPANAC